MTDRHKGYIVILADDLREEDSAAILSALGMVRGVISVQPLVADGTDLVALARAGERWRQAMVTLVQLGPDCVRDPRQPREG